jgi:hypothetical protein
MELTANRRGMSGGILEDNERGMHGNNSIQQ